MDATYDQRKITVRWPTKQSLGNAVVGCNVNTISRVLPLDMALNNRNSQQAIFIFAMKSLIPLFEDFTTCNVVLEDQPHNRQEAVVGSVELIYIHYAKPASTIP